MIFLERLVARLGNGLPHPFRLFLAMCLMALANFAFGQTLNSTLHVTSSPGGVTVTASPADNNGTTSGVTSFDLVYRSGTSVTLTAPVNTLGEVFDHWNVAGVNF